jgi:hypothetical protein
VRLRRGDELLSFGRVSERFANHSMHSRFLCLAYFRLFNGCGAKTDVGPQKGDKPKWHGQTETTYLNAVLLWLQKYWTH